MLAAHVARIFQVPPKLVHMECLLQFVEFFGRPPVPFLTPAIEYMHSRGCSFFTPAAMQKICRAFIGALLLHLTEIRQPPLQLVGHFEYVITCSHYQMN